MLEAKWTRSQPHRREPDKSGRQAEVARARCGLGGGDCGGWVAKKWIEDMQRMDKCPEAFRLPPGYVHRSKPSYCGFGYWELPRRAKQQRRRALLAGESLKEWRPRGRHSLTPDEYESTVTRTLDNRPVGVAFIVEGGRDSVPMYAVDPQATGGAVIVKCPNCDLLNKVRPLDGWDGRKEVEM